MATYANKLAQKDGQLVAKIDSSGGIAITKNMDSTVKSTVSQSQAGTVVVAAAALAIPVTHAIVTKSTGGAEALTIVDGLYNGQEVTITTTAAVGDGTLTVGTNSTGTGWATLVLTAAGDTATLKWVDDTVGWIVVGAAGVLAPPVISL